MFRWLRKRRFSQPLSTEKDFHRELERFLAMLADRHPFALVRFGDGEMTVINGQAIDLSGKCNGEHRYTPGAVRDEEQRARLRASLERHSRDYFVGIACPCCVGEEKFRELKALSRQTEAQLTWANLFVNANYHRFRASVAPIFASSRVSLVSHESSITAGLPFPVVRHFRVGPNAWVADYDRVLAEMNAYIDDCRVRNEIFLFCAGVLSNILIDALHRRFPENTYLDIGSVFDVELGLGRTRKYLRSGRSLRKTCVWI